MSGSGGDGPSAVSVLYSDAQLSSDSLGTLAALRKNVRTVDARGVCSRVYRLPASASPSSSQSLCIKRVVDDEQWPPHSVAREILALRTIWNDCDPAHEDAGRRLLIPLLAAFHDQSDEFSAVFDLVMPWHPCTLQDLLDEPIVDDAADGAESAVDRGSDARHSGQRLDERPSRTILRAIGMPYRAFAHQSVRDLFRGLRWLHARGISHRDVKPSNAVLHPADASIRLIDFGTCWLSDGRYAPGDDGRGGTTSEVGTGAYRSPESLFSPKEGYDAYKVDVWQAAATLAEIFLPLRKVAVPSMVPPCKVANGKLDWERALWDGDQATWAELGDNFDSHGSPLSEEEEPIETSPTGWKRETLFDGTRGDLGLADSIFTLCGLPDGDEAGEAQWPEAKHFQPSLDKMPFRRRKPAEGGLAVRLACSDANIVEVLQRCLCLSAGKRITADAALAMLAVQSEAR